MTVICFFFFLYIYFFFLYLRGVSVNDVKDRRAAGYIYDPARWSDANA